MMQYVLDAFKAFFDWCVSFVSAMINPILQPIADKIPDISFQATEIVQFLALINSWIALDLGVILLCAWFTIVLIFIVVKSILKVTPFMG